MSSYPNRFKRAVDFIGRVYGLLDRKNCKPQTSYIA
jgi:hypothetical protein